MKPRTAFWCAAALAALPLGTVSAQTPPANPPAIVAPAAQTVGRFTVELRLPHGGIIRAGEAAQWEAHLSDSGRPDPVLGPLGVPYAKISGEITAAQNAAKTKPAIYAKPVAGDYGIENTFAQSGDYTLVLTITPPVGNAESFTVSFPIAVAEASVDKKRKPDPSPYTLDIQTNPYRFGAGENATLTLTVKNQTTKETVKTFDDVKTVPLHLFLIKDDLSAFTHLIPVDPNAPKVSTPKDDTIIPYKDGVFTIPFAFPTAGQWRVWADCAPHNAGEMLLPSKIEVSGVRPLRGLLLTPTSGSAKSEDGTVLATLKNNRLTAQQTQSLVFALGDTRGGDVNDLQPWAGALAHLIAIDRDGKNLVYSPADETDPRNGRGGTVAFLVRFPRPDTYKMWLQFQRAGSVTTVPFVVRVNDK